MHSSTPRRLAATFPELTRLTTPAEPGGRGRARRLKLAYIHSIVLTIRLALRQGTPIAGAIISAQDGAYVGAACTLGGFVVVGAGLVLAARMVVSRRKGTPWV
jgi:hypothetical protein